MLADSGKEEAFKGKRLDEVNLGSMFLMLQNIITSYSCEWVVKGTFRKYLIQPIRKNLH